MTKLVGEIQILGLPKTPNVRIHYMAKAKENRKWRDLVHTACAKAGIASLELPKALLTFTRHSSRQPDYDNLTASFKAVQDGLVQARVIINDTHEVIGIPKYLWVKRATKLGGMTTIKVEVEEC